MITKQLKFEPETLERLAKLHAGLAARPNDRKLLVTAIGDVARELENLHQKSVPIIQEHLSFLDDLVHFGLAADREAAVALALELLKAKMGPELMAAIEKRYGKSIP